MDATRTPARRRAAMKLTAVLAVLLMAIFALNAPLTFASSSTATQPSATTAQQSSTADVSNQTTDGAIAKVAETANPATVTVINLQQQQASPFGQSGSSSDGDVVPVGSGSGYIVDAAGYVVTNNHVVDGGSKFQVTYADGTTVEATLVGTDPYQDVAVLKLDLANGAKVPGVLKFGDSSTVKVGDTVIAIGTPYGEYANSVTAGIVNAVDRSLDTGEGYSLPNLFQHDAAIYPGNSGGPLLNEAGEVIGMNVAKAVDPTTGYAQQDTSTNIDFAIESNAVKSIVDQLIKTGKVDRPYLGIRGQQTDAGQAVVSVEDGGPAAKAGLQANDVITAVDGQTVDANHSISDLILFSHKPGDSVKLTIDRDGATKTITVTLGDRPANAS